MNKDLKNIIDKSNDIAFFGGAGVSTESGIPDFRSEDGVFKAMKKYGFPPEVLLSHSFLIAKPEIVFDYYKNNLIYKDAKPNAAHIALADLEKEGKLKAVITQNIDGLHTLAGSKNVLELHGSVLRNYCVECGKKFNLDYILAAKNVPKCDACGNIVRPDVVFYEEPLDEKIMNEAIFAIKNADTLIVGGTSLVVYPAAGLVRYFSGNHLVLINKTETAFDNNANLIIRDKIGETFAS
ncbi:MAG: NAD-dependent protein deacylase [Clostridiales Family XIII bacterium]|jgi:NAD-dependent deacetylase|nr:NAD-dependent protein deacylase [Clostridiales Family XIII bacterium]